MKKLIFVLIFALAFLLVACEETSKPDPNITVNVISEELNGFMLVVKVEVAGEVKRVPVLTEATTQIANEVYADHLEEFAGITYTLIIEVYQNVSTESLPKYGSIGFKINASTSQPGLALIASYLKT